MGKTHKRLGTAGYQSSTANEDVLATLIANEGWTAGLEAKTLEFIAKADMVVKINGYTSTVVSGAELSIGFDESYGEVVTSFVTVTDGVEFVLSVTF